MQRGSGFSDDTGDFYTPDADAGALRPLPLDVEIGAFKV
jgi:hypothetical protein